MNRAPSPSDRWWNDHRLSCGGSYSKVKEPEGYSEKTAKAKRGAGNTSESLSSKHGCKDIEEMLSGKKRVRVKRETGKLQTSPSTGASASHTVFGGDGHKLDTLSSAVPRKLPASQDECRKQLIEAVEKRQQLAQNKGVKRKLKTGAEFHDIRTFCQTTPTDRGKRPRLSPDTIPPLTPHRHTDNHSHVSQSFQCPAYTDSEVNTSPDPASQVVQAEESRDGEEGRCVIDLSVTEDSASEDGAVVIDDNDDDDIGDVTEGESERGPLEVPLRMCPVCGRVDIPLNIINIHVAHCLDEETAEFS